MKFATLTVLTCIAVSGCYVQKQYGEPMDIERVHAALGEWERQGNPMTQRCLDEAGTLKIAFADKSTLDAECPGQPDIIGCTAAGTDWDGERHTSFLIREDIEGAKREDTIEHELRHWLAACAYGDSDHHHANPRAWYAFEGRDVR